MIIRDVNGAVLATRVLPAPVIFNQSIVLLGLPSAAAVSSQAPVGSIPFSADLLNVAGQPVITGLAITKQPNTISIASSAANPGGQLGILGGSIVLT